MVSIDPAWIALLGTIFGGVGLKVIEFYLGKSRVKIDDATNIRSELRMDNAELRKEVHELEQEVNKWREEYYNMRDKYVSIQTELTMAINKLKDDE